MFEYGYGGMTHQEWCQYWQGPITAELESVARLVATGQQAEAFDWRGKLYRMALQLSPSARCGDILAMDQWLGGSEGRLSGLVAADLAAGTGFLTKPMLEWTRKLVYAVDPSDVQLRQLIRACHPYGPVDRVWGSPDQEKIFDQISAGSLDRVVSFGGLHHIPNHEALFANVVRLLKPGGRMVAADVCLGTPLQRHFDEVVAKKCLTKHEANWLSPARLEAFCAGTDLELVRVEAQVPLTWQFGSETEMAWFFKALHAYPQDEAEVLEDLQDHLGWTVRDGAIHLNWPMLFFELVRR